MSEMFWLFALIVSMMLALRWPLVGFCMVYPMMLLCPLRFESFPVVNTPFGILAVFTAATALLARKAWRPGLFSSPIVVPYVLLVGVLLVFWQLEYGGSEASAFRTRLYLMGMWPFVLAWLILKTRRGARAVLMAMVASSIALAGLVLWLILTRGQAALGGDQEQSLRVLAGEDSEMQAINYIKMMVVALCSPLLLSVLLDGGLKLKTRLVMFGTWTVMIVCVLLTPYSSPILAIGLATGLLLVWRLFQRGQKIWSYALLASVLVGGVLICRIPSVDHTMSRIRDPFSDASASYRMIAFVDEPLAFLESPLIGHGAAIEPRDTPGGHMLIGHTSILRDASQWGLVFMIPFYSVLLVVGRQYLKLLKRVRTAVDVAVVRGMFVSFFVHIAIGSLITPTFGEIAQDSVFWTFAAVVLFWNQHADENQGTPFSLWERSRQVVS